MKFQTHNEQELNAGGTSLMGYVDVDYQSLVDKFGKPLDGDEYKVDAEWILLFDNGVIATIYNYKDGKNYNGEEGIETKDIRDWHIGGTSEESVKLVLSVLS